MNVRLIALNGNAGAFTDILATLATSRIELMEDEASATTGLQFKSPMDKPVAFTNTYVVSFGSEPIQIPNFDTWSHFRQLIGMLVQWTAGAFNFRAADKLLSARSNAAGATTIRFLEYE